jgi:NAD(P)H-nitrite reductase large subunit
MTVSLFPISKGIICRGGTSKLKSLIATGGGCPRIADIVAEDLNEDEVIELIRKCLDFYRLNARKMERTGRLMRRIKPEKLWKQIGVIGKSRY